jgi:hypothetical protein
MKKPSLKLVQRVSKDPAVLSAKSVCEEIERSTKAVTAFVEKMAAAPEVRFKEVEEELRVLVFGMARAAITLFLVLRESWLAKHRAHRVVVGGRQFRVAPAIYRDLATLFGVIRYPRAYMREIADGPRHGFFPLDQDLGLTSDRFSWNVLSRAVLLATKLSFAEARCTLWKFIPNPPSTEVIEQTVLGLGRYTADWFETQPAPDGEGEVLVVMIDGKGAPMATETELERRRGKRTKRKKAISPRHRGRDKRKRYPKKPRRKKGDKSKNAKMATMFVMFTLKEHGDQLKGPINRRIYASFGPKRHVFEIARREADKRGFTEESGKPVQLVTDGDQDLERYGPEFFPGAIHTTDIVHVIEKLWKAGECLFREGSEELGEWIEQQKERLYKGRVEDILHELRARHDAIPKTGPGNKGKRKRLADVHQYLVNRGPERMNYDELLDHDLEISTGMIEGIIKNVIGRRFDHGGSRWIKERAEALLQLRCIEVNGDWELFMQYVHGRMTSEAQRHGQMLRLQSQVPAPLPALNEAA